ncbi:MAG: glycosyltransferase family 2 protein [Chloroflexi bacterium]|nr:glycosyltransferase family 2 protein [Chloroflexota bacterium]
MDTPKISVVIVTWNRKKEVLETIQSVYDQDYPSFEIIVVDNGSVDDTCNAIRKSYPNVNLVELDRNLGPTGGRNAGINITRGEIVFCLDSDASLDQHTLQVVVQRFEQDPHLGVINSKILNAHTGEFDRNAGWAYSEKQKINSDREFFTHNFSEGGCAIRKEVFDKAGLFWEKLFFGREGEELALRVLDAGYKVLYYPSAVVYHRAPPEKKKPDQDRQYYDLRNSLYICLVRYPWWVLAWFAPLKILASSMQGLRWKNSRWVRKALVDVMQDFPSLLRDRRPIQAKTARLYLRFQREQGALSWNLFQWVKHKTG